MTANQVNGRKGNVDRIQYLFKLKDLLEAQFADLARAITLECGKTLAEAEGELRRAIENVEVACGTPILMQGDVLEDVASGIDEMMIRQPLGVTAEVLRPWRRQAMSWRRNSPRGCA